MVWPDREALQSILDQLQLLRSEMISHQLSPDAILTRHATQAGVTAPKRLNVLLTTQFEENLSQNFLRELVKWRTLTNKQTSHKISAYTKNAYFKKYYLHHKCVGCGNYFNVSYLIHIVLPGIAANVWLRIRIEDFSNVSLVLLPQLGRAQLPTPHGLVHRLFPAASKM